MDCLGCSSEPQATSSLGKWLHIWPLVGMAEMVGMAGSPLFVASHFPEG